MLITARRREGTVGAGATVSTGAPSHPILAQSIMSRLSYRQTEKEEYDFSRKVLLLHLNKCISKFVVVMQYTKIFSFTIMCRIIIVESAIYKDRKSLGITPNWLSIRTNLNSSASLSVCQKWRTVSACMSKKHSDRGQKMFYNWCTAITRTTTTTKAARVLHLLP